MLINIIETKWYSKKHYKDCAIIKEKFKPREYLIIQNDKLINTVKTLKEAKILIDKITKSGKYKMGSRTPAYNSVNKRRK